ncbi:NUDIX hydrolase [Guggenheimella bovis]
MKRTELKGRSIELAPTIKKYAVMILFTEIDGEEEIIFEKRAQTLIAQPGEVSFPGGRVEKDESYEEAAIRETMEELGIKEEDLEIFGPLDLLITHHNQIVSTWVGKYLPGGLPETYSKDEVDYLFSVPIKELRSMKPELHPTSYVLEIGENFPLPDYPFHRTDRLIPFYMTKEIIWGLTGSILHYYLSTVSE